MKKNHVERNGKKKESRARRTKDSTGSFLCSVCGEVLRATGAGMHCPRCQPVSARTDLPTQKEAVPAQPPSNVHAGPDCPDCGLPLHKEGGRCWVCAGCGYSSCPIG